MAPLEPRQLLRGTACTLEVAHRRERPHPPSPATEQCPHPQPSRTEGLLETRHQQVEASRISASGNPSSAPRPPRQQYLCRGHPSFPQTRPRPRPAHSRLFLFPPHLERQPSPSTAPPPSLKTPSLHVPSPGVGEPGQSPLQNWPQGLRDGPQRSGLLVLTGPLSDGRSQAVDTALTALLPWMARPTRGTGRRGRQAGRADSECSQPPSPPGAGKPRSSHRRENRATKCDQTHKVTQVGPSSPSPLGATPALPPPRPARKAQILCSPPRAKPGPRREWPTCCVQQRLQGRPA